MPQFMLLLYDNPNDWEKVSPEDMQKAIEKYGAWRAKAVGSARLGNDAGKVIRAAAGGGKPRVADGPYSETKEMLGGYYTIEAPNYEEAVKIALGHPHLEYGGTVEVRQLWSM